MLTKEIALLEGELSHQDLYNQNPHKFNQFSNKIVEKRKELDKAEIYWLELEEAKENLN